MYHAPPFAQSAQLGTVLALLVVGASGASGDVIGPFPSWLVHGAIASHFGESVCGVGDVNNDGFDDVVVGAIYHTNGEIEEGGAWLYLGSPAGADTTAAWHAEGDADNAIMGLDVSAAGDVNRDGFDDVVIGLPGRAQARLYLGSVGGLPATPDWIATGRGFFGRAAGSAGDVNGDGFADVLVGAMLDGSDLQMEGRVFLYLGTPGGLAPAPAWVMEGNQEVCLFGCAAAGAGDVNGDGFDDVIIGAPNYDHGEIDEGRAFVFHGSPSGLETTPAWTAESDQADTYFGFSAAGAGDVNGDGYHDVIVGATWWSQGVNPDDGAALVFLGSPAGLSPTPVWTTYGDHSELGFCVAGAGDVDRDGYADVLVGVPHFRSDQPYEGAALLFRGSLAGPAANPDWIGELDLTEAHLGQAVAGAGDVNGDGHPDVILGAPYSHCPDLPPCGPIPAFAAIYHAVATTGIHLGEAPRFSQLRLEAPWPNPIASSATIPFSLSRAGSVRLTVTDVVGREVAIIDNGFRASGRHIVTWNPSTGPRRLRSGVYFLSLSGMGDTAVRRLVIVR